MSLPYFQYLHGALRDCRRKNCRRAPSLQAPQCISVQCTMNCEALYEEIRLPHISDDPSCHRLCDCAVNPTAPSRTVNGHNFNNHHQRRPSSQEEHDNDLFWHHLDGRLPAYNDRTTSRFQLLNHHHQQSEWVNLVSNHHNHRNTPSTAASSSSTLNAESVSLREG